MNYPHYLWCACVSVCIFPRARRTDRHYDVVFLFSVFLDNTRIKKKWGEMRLVNTRSADSMQLAERERMVVFRPASVGNDSTDRSRTKVETKTRHPQTQSIKWIEFPLFCHLYTTLRSPDRRLISSYRYITRQKIIYIIMCLFRKLSDKKCVHIAML